MATTNSRSQQQRLNTLSEMLKKDRQGHLDKEYYDNGKITLRAVEHYRGKNKNKISKYAPEQKL